MNFSEKEIVQVAQTSESAFTKSVAELDDVALLLISGGCAETVL